MKSKESYKFLIFRNNGGFWRLKFSNEFDETGRNINYTLFNLKFDSRGEVEKFLELWKTKYEEDFKRFTGDKKVDLDIMLDLYKEAHVKWSTKLFIEKSKHGDFITLYDSPESFDREMIRLLTENKDYFYEDVEPKKPSFTEEDLEKIPQEFLAASKETLNHYNAKKKDYDIYLNYKNSIPKVIEENDGVKALDILRFFGWTFDLNNFTDARDEK